MSATIYSKNQQGYVFAERKFRMDMRDDGQVNYRLVTDFMDTRPTQVETGRLRRR